MTLGVAAGETRPQPSGAGMREQISPGATGEPNVLVQGRVNRYRQE